MGAMIPRGLKPRRGAARQRRFKTAGWEPDNGFRVAKSPGARKRTERSILNQRIRETFGRVLKEQAGSIDVVAVAVKAVVAAAE